MEKQIEKFWRWFVENQERFFNYNNENSHDYLLEIQAKLEFARNSEGNGIALEFSKLPDNRKRLEVSADGLKELFDTVIQIVDLAPELDNWEIVAFRQPIQTPFALQYQDMEFDTSKMFFSAYSDEEGELNLVIFGENFKNYDENLLFHYGLTTVDNLIGEYNCVMKVKGYDFVDKDEIGDQEVYALEELPDFLDSYYAEED